MANLRELRAERLKLVNYELYGWSTNSQRAVIVSCADDNPDSELTRIWIGNRGDEGMAVHFPDFLLEPIADMLLKRARDVFGPNDEPEGES